MLQRALVLPSELLVEVSIPTQVKQTLTPLDSCLLGLIVRKVSSHVRQQKLERALLVDPVARVKLLGLKRIARQRLPAGEEPDVHGHLQRGSARSLIINGTCSGVANVDSSEEVVDVDPDLRESLREEGFGMR